MVDSSAWMPLFLVAGIHITLRHGLRRGSALARGFSAWLAMLCTLRYLGWRIVASQPHQTGLAARIWADSFLLAELASGLSTLLVYFFLSRTRDRSPEADRRVHSLLHDLPVDVLVVTYNENRDILERTLVGALAIGHPDLRVWLLDDGARAWAREMAGEMGVQYVARVKGKHAKAGNINHALPYVLDPAGGRRPEFLLLLDADFVPAPHILRRTLGLFEEEEVGIVQTPQHFFNHDPVQTNLLCAGAWPDEQRFFFNEQMPARDAWGTAFCCGTSAVIRTRAMEVAGGFATETVTEDMLTTLKFKEHGYRTIFLNERLSLGLAPESLRDYVSQRSRWCLGAIQQIYTRYSFVGSARMGLLDRVAFFDTVLYWIAGSVFKLMMWVAPAVFWWTGACVMQASGEDLARWVLPSLASNLFFMRYYSGNRVLPVMTDVSQLLSATTILRTVAHGLVRPFGHSFKVTAKGISSERVTVHWQLLWPFAAIAVLTLSGMLLHLARFSPGHGTEAFTLNLVWSLIGVTVMSLSVIACIEQPRRRRHERFDTNEEALLVFPDGSECVCRMREISTGGAQVESGAGWSSRWTNGTLVMESGRIRAAFTVVRSTRQCVAVEFEKSQELRRALILKLYTGRYNKEVQEIRLGANMRGLARVLTS